MNYIKLFVITITDWYYGAYRNSCFASALCWR